MTLWRCSYKKNGKRRVRWFVYKHEAFEYAEVLGPEESPIEVDYEEIESFGPRLSRFGLVKWLNESPVAGGNEHHKQDSRFIKVGRT